MDRAARARTAILIATLGLGCGSQGGASADAGTGGVAPDGGGVALSLQAFYEELAVAGCEKIFACCDAEMRRRAFVGLQARVTDVASCVAAAGAARLAEANRREAQIRRGVTRFRADLATACLEAARAAPCGSLRSTSAPAPCNALFEGTQAGGAVCSGFDECATGFCAAPSSLSPGGPARCSAAKPCFWDVEPGRPACPAGLFCEQRTGVCGAAVGRGQRCDPYGGLPCASGSFCVTDAPAATNPAFQCRAPGAEGASCEGNQSPFRADEPCLPGLVCVKVQQSAGTWLRTCVAPGPAGAPCSEPRACAEGVACQGARYPLEMGTCLAPGGAGARCLAQEECQAGNRCSFDSGGTIGTCTLRAGPGESCKDRRAPCDFCRTRDCVDGHFCDLWDRDGRPIGGGMGVCTPEGTAGARCRKLSDCVPDAYCTVEGDRALAMAGTCLPRMAAGAACTEQTQCATGHYCTVAPARSGECRPLLEPGTPCDHFAACRSGDCFFTSGTSTGVCVRRGDPAPRPAGPPPTPTFGWPEGCRPPAAPSGGGGD